MTLKTARLWHSRESIFLEKIDVELSKVHGRGITARPFAFHNHTKFAIFFVMIIISAIVIIIFTKVIIEEMIEGRELEQVNTTIDILLVDMR